MATHKSPSPAKPSWPLWLEGIASVRLTLSCVLLAMGLITAGTLAQVHLGTFQAQKEYFNSWCLFMDVGDWRVPFFPGGLTVGALWLINLVASFITRFRLTRKDMGIFITHAGLILLLAGQFLTQTLARESQMPIEVGHSRNYSESPLSTELVLIKTSNPQFDEVTAIPETIFMHEGEIHPPRLSFYLVIHRFFRNAHLGLAPAGTLSLANQGIGTRIAARETAPVASDDEANNVTAYVEVRDKGGSKGIWLVSTGLGASQSFTVEGVDYRILIRPKRTYYPFTLTLKEFHHDIYPGTDIPKNFSSLVHLSNPIRSEDRDALIFMNHPLRYEGKTFYQASFGEGDMLSVFQVVENPAYAAPYISCALVVLGLLIQFMSHLMAFARKRP